MPGTPGSLWLLELTSRALEITSASYDLNYGPSLTLPHPSVITYM